MTYLLRKITLSDEINYLKYSETWKDEKRIVPNSAHLKGKTFQAFLSELILREEGLFEPERMVPDHTYILVDEDQNIYGVLNLRLKLNDYLYRYDGHIGYGIAPSYRNKGLGKMILKLGLEKCLKLNINPVLVTCDEDNIASKKVILDNGGVLENKVYKTDGYIERYWITLTSNK